MVLKAKALPLPYAKILIDKQNFLLSHIGHKNWASTPANDNLHKLYNYGQEQYVQTNIPLPQHYILPQVLLLSSGFAKDHQTIVKHLGRAGRTWEMDFDDNPGKGNYCSVVTLLIQSDITKKRNKTNCKTFQLPTDDEEEAYCQPSPGNGFYFTISNKMGPHSKTHLTKDTPKLLVGFNFGI